MPLFHNPPITGDYSILIKWNGVPLPRMPIRGFARGAMVETSSRAMQPEHTQTTMVRAEQHVNHDKVMRSEQHVNHDKVMRSEQHVNHERVVRSEQHVNHEKVVLTGLGLQEARVREEAEFVVDGTDAGPGK